jgi:hypothetical protein
MTDEIKARFKSKETVVKLERFDLENVVRSKPVLKFGRIVYTGKCCLEVEKVSYV